MRTGTTGIGHSAPDLEAVLAGAATTVVRVTSSLRSRLRDAYWFVPALLVLAAGLLALGLIGVDRTLKREGVGFAFTGGADSARSVLGTIAASMLSLTALVFSITVLVLQLASTQFSPRVLRTFLHDRQNQITLGVFAGTFVYALAALSSVRGRDGLVDLFVPGVTITVGFVLVVVSVGLFVAYIHHITQSIRVATIIDRIAAEADLQIERELVPVGHSEQPAAGRPPASPAPVEVPAPQRGVVLAIDHDALCRGARREGSWIEVLTAVGDFVPEGFPVARVHGAAPAAEEVTRAFDFGIERTIEGDIGFGFRQLVDIAERALSPGINDPSTAVQCLDQLHHLLRRLAPLELPTGLVLDDEGACRVVHPVTSWEQYVRLALDEIRNVGSSSIQVHQRIERLLADLATVAPPDRRPVLDQQLADLRRRRSADLPPDAQVASRPRRA